MAVALFRLLGAILKTMVVANTFGMFAMLLIFLFAGILLPRRKCLFLKRKYVIVENELSPHGCLLSTFGFFPNLFSLRFLMFPEYCTVHCEVLLFLTDLLFPLDIYVYRGH